MNSVDLRVVELWAVAHRQGGLQAIPTMIAIRCHPYFRIRKMATREFGDGIGRVARCALLAK